MMAHKHLHELLKEDQEPFFLNDHLANRRSQLKRPIPRNSLQSKKRKPMVESFCKQACFLSFQDSPDVRKSPFHFPSPAPRKGPCKSPNAVVLHVPARTAAVLLEAAMRIQTQPSCSKPKTQVKNIGFGLFGSILKRLGSKNRNGAKFLPRKSAGKSGKVRETSVDEERARSEIGFSCSCSNSRRNSTVWSESNEEKSLDLETCSSGRSEDSEEIEFGEDDRENGVFTFCEKHFCTSPMSPFRFALQTSPSPGRRKPVFSPPATSPSLHETQDKEKCEEENTEEIHLEEEEEKEQCSPVSVLDPPFEDDDDGDGNDDDDDEGYDLECSYALVQRAKQQLLHKLMRFEKLAGLDPIELEKRMLEEQEDDDEEEDDDDEEETEEKKMDSFVREVVSKSGLHCGEASPDMKRLVLDLVAEEKREADDGETAAKQVCQRLDSWKEVQSNTIDMMVELDFRRELDGWKRSDKEQLGEAAMEIELSIFGLLVEELSEDLVYMHGH